MFSNSLESGEVSLFVSVLVVFNLLVVERAKGGGCGISTLPFRVPLLTMRFLVGGGEDGLHGTSDKRDSTFILP